MATEKTAILYPNPISLGALINIKIETTNQEFDIEIYNMQGQRVLQKTVRPNRETSLISLPTHSLSSGLFMIKMKGSDWSSTSKICIGY